MNWGKALAWTVCSVQAGAAIGYLFNGDVKRSLYWALCCALTGIYTS